MRKVFLLALLLVFVFCPAEGALAAECSAVSCISSEPDGDGLYTVSVELEDCTGLAMIQFALSYDPELLECVSAETGALLADNIEPTINADIPGKIYFVWDDLEPLDADGELLTLQMRLLTENAAELSFDFGEDFIFAKDDFSEIELFTNGCTLGETPDSNDEAPETPALTESKPWITAGILCGAVIAAAIVVLRMRKDRRENTENGGIGK